jgi:hypothetical protein
LRQGVAGAGYRIVGVEHGARRIRYGALVRFESDGSPRQSEDVNFRVFMDSTCLFFDEFFHMELRGISVEFPFSTHAL